MFAGQIIIYRIKLFPEIKLSWVTEITHVIDEEFFIDEQRFGPYKFWHHQHRFIETAEGIEVHDLVHYSIPFGIIGRMTHKLFIKRKLDKIFQFRRDILEAKYGKESKKKLKEKIISKATVKKLTMNLHIYLVLSINNL